MASSKTAAKGYLLPICTLCERQTNIRWNCLTCDMVMCTKCKDKIHSKFTFDKDHKFIEIIGDSQTANLLDFSDITCREHKGLLCCLYCKTCDTVVCPVCISRVHNGHGLMEISDGYERRLKKLKKIKNNLQEHLNELERGEVKFRSIESNGNAKYENTKTKIESHNAACKIMVDQYSEKLMAELESSRNNLHDDLEKAHDKVDKVKKRILEKIYETEEMIKMKDLAIFFAIFESEDFSEETNEILETRLKPIPSFSPGEITQFNFGTLQEETREIEVLNHFKTNISRVVYMSTCLDGCLWITDQNILQKVQADGLTLNLIASLNIKVYGLALAPSGDVLLVTKGSTLEKIDAVSGELVDTKFSVEPFIPTAIYVSKDEKMIVGCKSKGGADDRRLILVLNNDGEVEATYEHGKHNIRYFTYVENVTNTHNGNVFAIDQISDDSTGRIVVLNEAGECMNIYGGHPDININDRHFQPVGIVPTPTDNVIISELNINVLHILNNAGQFITHINTGSVAIIRPCSLAIDTSGQIFIGCNTPEGSLKKAKLYKVSIFNS